MKRWILALALMALVPMLGGCGVWMNARYRLLLDETVALSAETATRAEAGRLTNAEMAEALRLQSHVWKRFQDARDGKAED